MSAAIFNVVYACPGNNLDDYAQSGRAIATFYAELLDMSIQREDWFVISGGRPGGLDLAFGDGPIDYQPPRWPDPDFPQQLHIDISVRDLDAAEERALRLGAVRLQDKGAFRSYADPIGHPFCLYPGDADFRISRIVFDCLSPRALAAFYAELLDLPRRPVDTPERVVIAGDRGTRPELGFQHAVFPAPRWPDPAYPQQVHLDIAVDDPSVLEAAERLGAIRLPALGGSAPVYADPAGHPICLCGEGQ